MIGRILIIGLGLMGGSLAKAFKKLGYSIDSYDINKDYLELAKKEVIISEIITSFDIPQNKYDFIFICTPVKETLEILKILSSKRVNSIITDIGSTKKEIVESAMKLNMFNFIGGHPMAGTEMIGYPFSNEKILSNAYYFITPTIFNNQSDIAKLKELLTKIGCRVEEIDFNIHDYLTGIISHLPHVASAALVNMLQEENSFDYCKFAAGGFKDTTRISSSSPKMWLDVSLSNKEILNNLIDKYIDLINNFKKALNDNNKDFIFNYFNTAKTLRDKIVREQNGNKN
ncbi:prephenate dehydrogenase [Caldicellulosiruptoraceae bacterium PP1]